MKKNQFLFKKAITGFFFILLSLGMINAATYYVDPATGNINNNGSEASPWNTFQNVISAGKSLAPGDVVYLKNGNHGWPSITNRNNGGVVTIKAYPGHSPIINRLDMNNSSNWKFEGIRFHSSSAPPNTSVPLEHPVYPLWDNFLIRITGSSYVTFDNAYIYSIENSAGWSATNWNYGAWNGIRLHTGTHHVTITNSLLKNLNFAIDFLSTHTNTISYNTVTNFCGDGMRVSTNCVIEYNSIKDAYATNGNHVDAIQGFASSGATIRGNIMINTTSVRNFVAYSYQGIGLFDGYFDNYVIENNLIVQHSWEALAVYGARGCRVVNNTIIDNPLVAHSWGPPWLNVRKHKNGGAATNNIVRNNFVSSISSYTTGIGALDHNIVAGSGTYGSHFINPGANDYRLKAGSSAINAGSASSAPTIDLNKFPRSGNPDIGCYEYGSYAVGQDTEDPSAPGTPVVTGSTIASVSLSWAASTDNEGVVSYNIYADGALAGTSAGTSGTANGLTPSTQYTFTVTALDAAGNESDPSSGTQGSTQNATIISATSATASSYEAPDNVPANAIDGNLVTRWASDGDGQWLQLDLGGSANISDIGLAFYMGDQRSYTFDLQASTNGTNWTTIYSGSSSGSTITTELFDVTDATASYIRYVGHGNSTNTWNNVNEIVFYSVGPPDTQAPSVPGTPIVGTVTTSSVALSWSASTDNVDVTGYKVYTDGSNPQTVSGTSATISGLADNTQYTFTVSAVDAASNESAQSGSAQATTVEITGVTSSTTWQSFQESTQTGEFTATFTAVPNGNNIDVLTGLQNGSASAYGDMACIIRFNTGGNIDARNGGAYAATNTVSYSSGISYAFRVEVDVTSHTYDVFVTPQGGSEQTVASNFAFRTEQASVSQITGWTVYGYQGTHTVDNMTFTGEEVDTEAPSVPGTPVVGTVTTSSVSLSWSASTDNVGVTGYKVYTNGSNPQSVGGTSTTISGLADGTTYNFTVSAVDAASNESAQSGQAQATTVEITGVTSSATWQSFQELTETGEFTATFTAVPNGNNIDALTGLQNGTASAYGDMACIIRFNTSGNIDARNGGTYTATNTVSYSSGISYAFRVEVNVPAHTYSVYVTPAGGSEQTVASNFAFRTEQASVSQITGWTVYGYQGTHTVDNMSFSGEEPDTQAPSVPGTPVASNITSSSVDLSWAASTDNVGVTGYKVYTNGSNPVTVGGTSTTISGLAAETQYSFTVSAVDAASNESAQSSAEVVTTDEEPTAPNLISNGEFDNGTTDWFAGNYGGTASLAAVTGQGMSGTNAMQISISAAGTNTWDIQIYQDFAIENGKSYEISFQAKAASNRSIAAIIQDTDSPYSEYWHQDVNLTTSAQSFGPYTFNSSTTDATCRFKFFVGGNATTVYVDNIVVSDVTSSSAQVELASNESSFKLYPNPLNGEMLNVELNGYNTEVNVAIFDMMGRVVYNTVENVVDNSLVEIPSDILNKGIYIISVKGEGINKQQKLVVE